MAQTDTKLSLRSPYFQQVLLVALILMLFAPVNPAQAWGQTAYSMKAAKSSALALPQSVQSALGSQAYGVYETVNGVQILICEVFWVRDIAAPVDHPATNLFYSSLRPGTFLGLVHFFLIERYVRDYRSQIIRPGFYTMRYAAMPDGANGTEVDVALLSPLAMDPNPAKLPARDEVLRRARHASGTNRPLMMSLPEIDNDQKFPSLTTDEEGTCVMQVKTRVRPSKPAKPPAPHEFPLALTVVTAIPEDLGD